MFGESFECGPESGVVDGFCCFVQESFLYEELDDGHAEVVVELLGVLVLVCAFEVEDGVAFRAVLGSWWVEFFAGVARDGLELVVVFGGVVFGSSAP